MDRSELENPEIVDLVKHGLAQSDPCAELVAILDGTTQIINGVKYQFRVETKPKSSGHCQFDDVDGFDGNDVRTLTVIQPGSRSAKPSYTIS